MAQQLVLQQDLQEEAEEAVLEEEEEVQVVAEAAGQARHLDVAC